MDPVSESHIGKIPSSTPISDQPGEQPADELSTLEQVVAAEGEAGVYTGPERRAQGYLVAELIDDSPALGRQAPEFDPPR